MIRNFFIAGIIASSLLLNGCGTLYLNAPDNQSIKLMSKYKPAEVRVEKKIWFKWWGSEPIDIPDTASVIKEKNLKEVRLYMTNTFVDGLYSVFPGMIGFPRRTLIIEGNR